MAGWSQSGSWRSVRKASYHGEPSTRGGGGEAPWIHCRRDFSVASAGTRAYSPSSSTFNGTRTTSRRMPSRATSRTWTPMSLPFCQLIWAPSVSSR